jgi:hypothetical protein
MRLLLAALTVIATTPGVHHTPAGMTAAHRALVTRTNLGPGWKAGATPKKPGALACRAPATLKGVIETGVAVSPLYSASGSGPFVSASSFVYDTAAGAARFFEQIAKPNALPCLSQSLASGKSAAGVTFTVTRRQTLAAPRLGVTAAAYRVVGHASVAAQRVTVYADVILLQHASTIVELSFASFSAPVPAATETRIGRAAASRL